MTKVEEATLEAFERGKQTGWESSQKYQGRFRYRETIPVNEAWLKEICEKFEKSDADSIRAAYADGSDSCRT